jgi:hypothetical protein
MWRWHYNTVRPHSFLGYRQGKGSPVSATIQRRGYERPFAFPRNCCAILYHSLFSP